MRLQHHERMGYSFSHRLWISFFILSACALLARCATTKGGGELRADAVIKKTESIEEKSKKGKAIVQNSNASQEEKKQLTEIFEDIGEESKEIREPVKQLGHDVDINKMVADKWQAVAESLKKYRTILISIVVGSLGFLFVWLKFVRK